MGGTPGEEAVLRVDSANNPVSRSTALLRARGGQSASILLLENGNGAVLSRFDKSGFFMTRKTTAPLDADLAPGELALWFDSTPAAARLVIKARDGGGTVRTGSVALA